MNNADIKAKQLRAIEIGGGVKAVLNEGCRILGNPALIHDMEYEIIALADGVVTDDPIWNEYAGNGTVSLGRIEFFKTEEFLSEAANVKSITRLVSDKLKYDRLFAKMLNADNIQIGAACMVEAFKPFESEDLELFGLFCEMLNKEFALDGYYTAYGQAYQETLISMLIDGGIEDRAIYAAHIESVYMNLKTNLYLAVLDAPKCEPTALRDALKRAVPRFKYAVYGGRVVIILSFDRHMSYQSNALERLERQLEHHDARAGVSGGFENLFELDRHFKAAVQALSYGQRGDEQRVFFAAEMEADAPS